MFTQIFKARTKRGTQLSALLLGVILIPLDKSGRWEVEKYANIPSHVLNFSPEGLNLHVKGSASPLFYPLEGKQKVLEFTVEGDFKGLPQFAAGLKQGEKGADDYAQRVGFIVPGDKQLSGIKRLIAPAWIKNLYDKFPKGSGLDHIHFFNITQDPSQVGSSRVHPLSDLIQEDFIAAVSKPGRFQYTYTMKKPLEAVALWISVDGDDTKSNYEVLISKLELKVDP